MLKKLQETSQGVIIAHTMLPSCLKPNEAPEMTKNIKAVRVEIYLTLKCEYKMIYFEAENPPKRS